MQSYLIRNAAMVNEGRTISTDLLIKNGRIEKIAPAIDTMERAIEIDAAGLYMLPGAIDDQVHFREPGLTHKANIYTEAKAAVAGGGIAGRQIPDRGTHFAGQLFILHGHQQRQR
jgi:dihydroorotase